MKILYVEDNDDNVYMLKGKRHSLRDAMTSTPSRWTCPACSERSQRWDLNKTVDHKFSGPLR